MSALRRIGHKGADLIVPGNTAASFDAALAAGVDMIEFDVLPEDRDAAGRRPAACWPTTTSTWPARRRWRTGSPTSRPRRSAAVELDVDLKLPGYEARVVEALRAHGLVERTLVSSNWMRSLVVLRELEPRLRLGWSVPRVRKRLDARLAHEGARLRRASASSARGCPARSPATRRRAAATR